VMLPFADQSGEISFWIYTKVKRVQVTLRGESFPPSAV